MASVLSMRPKLLALDEPASNLDPRGVSSLVRTLENFEGTLVVATHDFNFALLTCERAAIMDEGKVVAGGRMKEITSDRPLLLRHGLLPDP